MGADVDAFLRARALHADQQLDQPSIARVGAGAIAGLQILYEAAVLSASFRSEEHREVRLLARPREDVSQSFCQQRYRTAAFVLENQEICIRQAFDRLESKDAYSRIEYKVLPLIPGLAAGTACLEGVVVLSVLFFCACHAGILRPGRP